MRTFGLVDATSIALIGQFTNRWAWRSLLLVGLAGVWTGDWLRLWLRKLWMMRLCLWSDGLVWVDAVVRWRGAVHLVGEHGISATGLDGCPV